MALEGATSKTAKEAEHLSAALISVYVLAATLLKPFKFLPCNAHFHQAKCNPRTLPPWHSLRSMP